MVMMSTPSAWTANIRQARTASPLNSTVHAPLQGAGRIEEYRNATQRDGAEERDEGA